MPQVQVRLVTEADGEQLRELGHRSADGGRIAFRPHYRATLAEAHQVRRPGSTGFVAVAPDGSLVGSAWVTPSPIANRDVTLRLAWFHSLAVDPDWRGRGIAGQLTEARLDHVGGLVGPTVVGAAIQAGNAASLRAARHWAHRVLGTVRVTPVPPPRRPPRPALDVRRVVAEDLVAVSDGIRATARDLALAAVSDADELAEWLGVELRGPRIHHYLVAADPSGRLVAGLGLEDEGSLQSLEIVHLPMALRLANLALRVVPRDGHMRNINVRLPFVRPGHESAARHLWEVARWTYRDAASSLVTATAPGGRLASVLHAPAWLPSTSLSVVLRDHPDVRLADGSLAPWV